MIRQKHKRYPRGAEVAMNKQEIFESFHNDVAKTDTEQIQCLHDLCEDGTFRREAGREFVLAVDAVTEERGMS